MLRDRSIVIAALCCLTGFGGFFLWAVFAPLAEGVTAYGQLVIEDNRKVIQHLEGGIIQRVEIREGAHVERGDVLIELEQTASKAVRDEIALELVGHYASLDRLSALREKAVTPVWKRAATLTVPEPSRQAILDRQTQLFRQQLEAHIAEVAVLESRRETILARKSARQRQIKSVERALQAAEDELLLKRTMLEDKLERIDTVQRLEREAATLESQLGALIADDNEADASAIGTEREIDSTRATYAERISESIVETRRLMASAEERLKAADDILDRSVIRAPQSGVVLNLRFSTVGGVIRPGEPLLEIVPDERTLVAEVRVPPADRDSVYEGLTVKARLSAYKSWKVPTLSGEVLSVSADLKEAPNSEAAFYTALIQLDTNTIASDEAVTFLPGMPIESFIASGRSRTFMDYLLEPIAVTFRRGLSL